MFHIACNQCGKWHISADPSPAQLECGCCTQAHDHVQAANECPGQGFGHSGAACPVSDGGLNCTAGTEVGEPCPGEHCGLGVDGCTVCRPVTITLLPAQQAGA